MSYRYNSKADGFVRCSSFQLTNWEWDSLYLPILPSRRRTSRFRGTLSSHPRLDHSPNVQVSSGASTYQLRRRTTSHRLRHLQARDASREAEQGVHWDVECDERVEKEGDRLVPAGPKKHDRVGADLSVVTARKLANLAIEAMKQNNADEVRSKFWMTLHRRT